MKDHRNDADQRQPGVQVQHEGAVEGDERHVEHDAGELSREYRRNRVVAVHASGEVACTARKIEADRQAQRMPHETARHPDAELHQEFHEVGALQSGKRSTH